MSFGHSAFWEENQRITPGIRQKIVLYADLQEVRNGEVLGRHKIEQFGCRLEIDDLVPNENLGVSKFVPRLLRLHDPGNVDRRRGFQQSMVILT